MIAKKAIIDNELMKEIISIRINTLWKMLSLKKRGEMPDADEEGATGKYDNKGAIFIPGGLIYQDVDEKPIDYYKYIETSSNAFRKQIRSAMRYDNATLLYPDGIAKGINLDSGFFSKAARNINIFKKAAFRRKKKISSKILMRLGSEDIIRSHCPTYLVPPYGARTRISTCISIGLTEPSMFFAYYKTELNFSKIKQFSEQLDNAQHPVLTEKESILYPPYIVVCHDTRYSQNNYVGLTRILGIGKFGEFATFTLEKINTKLLNELKRKEIEYTSSDIFADYDNRKILGILRVYAPTNPGRRSKKYATHIISPFKDLDIDIDQLSEEAKIQYKVK